MRRFTWTVYCRSKLKPECRYGLWRIAWWCYRDRWKSKVGITWETEIWASRVGQLKLQAVISLLLVRAVMVFLLSLHRHKAVTNKLGSRLLLSVCARCDLLDLDSGFAQHFFSEWYQVYMKTRILFLAFQHIRFGFEQEPAT